MTTPEGRVKRDIKKFLRDVPDCWFFMPIGGPYTVHGIPDIVGLVGGKFFAIEAKAPGRLSTVTANQEAAMAGIRAAGGMAMLAADVDTVREEFIKRGWYVGTD